MIAGNLFSDLPNPYLEMRIQMRRFCTLLSSSLALSLSFSAMGSALPGEGSESTNAFTIDHSTLGDPKLQKSLEEIDAEIRQKHGLEPNDAAAGIFDLKTGRAAMIHPDRMEYAASVPKIGILLAYFHFYPEKATDLDAETHGALGEMIKISSNEMATRFSREIGLHEIQEVLNKYDFYNKTRGGGIWVGKHYGVGDERYGDPIADYSHAATVRQLLRFYLLLDQGKLVSPEASATMREIFASPAIPHDPIKFVKGLAGRDVELLRKWGTWRNWRHDSALIEGSNRRYILVGLTNHANGDEYLADLATAADDLMAEN